MSDLKRHHRPECHSYPLTIPTSVPYTIHASPQIVIAHRGASSHLPEHTLASYRLALELGADYIEPDLVSTKDQHLVAIHSIDLSITTNVESVFGRTGIKNKTISNYKGNKNGLEGYWVYDFTLEEIKKLRVTQRLGSSSDEDNSGSKRSTEFDGVFQIPTLIEILELLNDWNENIQPLWYNNNNVDGNNDKSSVILSSNSNKNNNNKEETQHPKQPHHYPPPPRGIYAELKDFYWLLEDTNINLLDVLFDQIQITTGTKNNDVWNNALLKNMCDTKILFEHEYRLPPLVIQSFDVDVLKNFTHRWDQIAVTKTENGKSSLTYEVISSKVNDESDESPIVYNIPLPTPPTILLISNDKCHDEKFWFDIEDNYRDYINGIGPDKNCFFQTTISEKNKEEATPPSTKILQYVPTIMEKAKENNWVVHPWTERPEKQFLVTTKVEEGDDEVGSSSSSPFRSILDELIYMKCTIGIHGIFSESVDIAVRVMNMPCPTIDTIDSSIATTTSCPTTTTTTGSNSFINEIPIGPVILFSFVSGILTALMILKYCIGSSTSSSSSPQQQQQQQQQQRRNSNRNRRRRTGHSVLPTTNTDDDDDNDDHDNDSIVDDNDNDNDTNEDYDDDDDDDTSRAVV